MNQHEPPFTCKLCANYILNKQKTPQIFFKNKARFTTLYEIKSLI